MQSAIPRDNIFSMQTGAIILCGGKSTRMGRDKATLPFGPECMLQRIVRLLGDVISLDRMVVVTAVDQQLPELPSGILIARDQRPQRGPLEGLAAGWRALPETVEAVYATSCDVPLLVPAFVRRMFDLLENYDIAVPCEGEYHHPLAAVYRRAVLERVERLLSAERLRPRFLFDELCTREVPVDDLQSVDPRLDTLKNLNTPEDYQSALFLAGIVS